MTERLDEGAGRGSDSDSSRWPFALRLRRSAIVSDGAAVLAIARAENRRDRHRLLATRRKIALVVLISAVFLPVFVGMATLAVHVGGLVTQGELVGLLDLARWYLPVVLTLYALVSAIDTNSHLLNFGARDLHLTSVRSTDLVYGLLLADARTWLLLIGPAVLLVLAFGYGTGSIAAAVIGATTLALLLAIALLWGTVLGLTGRLVRRRLRTGNVSDAVLHALKFVLLFVVFGTVGALSGVAAERLGDGVAIEAVVPDGRPPAVPGHVADLLFVGTPLVDGISVAALASGTLLALTIPFGAVALTQVAPRLWYRDETHRSGSETAEPVATADDAKPDGLQVRRDWLSYSFPTGFVAEGIVRRTARTPDRLVHLVYYVVAAGMLAAGITLELTVLATLLGQTLLFLGIYLAGGTFGLNLLGEEGAMLEQLALSEFSAQTFVRARILAGTAVGTPVVVLGVLLLSVHEYAVWTALLVGTVWLLMVPASSAIAVGVGSLLPRTEPGELLDLQVPTPEMLAILVHGGVVTLLALGGSGFAVGAYGLPVSSLGAGFLLVSTVVLADCCYRFAVDAIDTYGRSGPSDVVLALEIGFGLSVLGYILSMTFPVGVAVPFGGSGPIGTAAVLVASALGWGVAGVIYVLGSGQSRAYLDFSVPDPDDRSAVLSSLAVSICVAAALRVGLLPDAPFPETVMANELSATGGVLVAAGVLLASMYAISVEFLFRNVVQKRLGEALPDSIAVLLAALLFTGAYVPLLLGHALVVTAVSLCVSVFLSAVWGWVYVRSRSVIPPIACHACFGIILVA